MIGNRTPRRIVFASSNLGKLAELRVLLRPLPWEVLALSELLGQQTEIAETAKSFEENALIKARAAVKLSGVLSLADDSGLEVDALGGRPGVFSSRFAHENATDEENNRALLARLQGVPVDQRTARFRCVLALCGPKMKPPCLTVQGVCEGRIALAPRPGYGFGYDPLFRVAELGDRYMSELTMEQKNSISHRGRALRALVAQLEAMEARQGLAKNS